MATVRLVGRRGDGSAVVNGWVAFYTLGLPAPMRERRRGEISADLNEEAMDAVRRGERASLRGRRLIRWALGIPDDLWWRLTDARAMAARYPADEWVAPSRWTLALLAIVAVGAAGGLALTLAPLLDGTLSSGTWAGWGPHGFAAACTAILIGVVLSIPRPGAGAALLALGVIVGFLAAPWLIGCWGLSAIAVALRWQQATSDGVGG